jgi:hypothetical protein
MPQITLADGSTLEVTRISDHQLQTGIGFSGRRTQPVIVEVVRVNGADIPATKLVIGDTHSIWLNHQTHLIPRRGRDPAVPTGLATEEGARSQALFLRLARSHSSAADEIEPDTSDKLVYDTKSWPRAVLVWCGKHLGQIIAGVIVAVITAVVLAWLGLKG